MSLKNKEEIFIVIFVFIILKISLYLFDEESYFNGEFSIYRLTVSLATIFYFLYKLKQENKNLAFREVFFFSFMAIVGMGLFGWVLDAFIYNYLDNTWLNHAVNIEYQAQKSELEAMNATGSLDRDFIEQDMIKEHSIWGLLKSFLFSLPFSAIFSFFIGLLFQSKSDD